MLMRRVSGWLFLLLIAGFTLLMLRITVPYLDGRYNYGFLLTKQYLLHRLSWRIAFYVHIVCSLPVLALGTTQFLPALLKNRPGLHRMLGKVYVVTILLLSAPSGLIMAFHANGGPLAQTAFVLLSCCWWLSTWMAYSAIRKGKIDLHIAWMLRSYALTLSAITLRLYVLVLPQLFHISGLHLYLLVSWLSWIPNLLVAELLIRKQVVRQEEV